DGHVTGVQTCALPILQRIMLSMRILIPVLILALTAGCGAGRRTVRADAPQQWFRVTLGLTDADPADWSGSIEVAGGRLGALHSEIGRGRVGKECRCRW